MKLLDVVQCAQTMSFEQEEKAFLTPGPLTGARFYVQGTLVGLVKPSHAQLLSSYKHVFELINHCLFIKNEFNTTETITAAIESVLLDIKEKRICPFLDKWRHEQFDVYGTVDQGILFRVERSAVGILGVRSNGCHLNGYVKQDGQLRMWVAQRSFSKQTYPGYLDNIVGGGLPSGMDPFDNILKESQEEAGIPEAFTKKCVPVGAVSFYLDCDRGWMPDIEYNYDLELPSDFIPTPADGEVYQFFLWDLPTVLQNLLQEKFTPEAGLVVIDFLIRHGFITPSNEPDYLDIVAGLHRRLRFPSPRFSKLQI